MRSKSSGRDLPSSAETSTPSAPRSRTSPTAPPCGGCEADDPARFSWPVAYEPLFETAHAHGFEWADANVAAPTTSHDAVGLPDHVPLRLDWILIRGLDARRAAVTACDGLSDHQVVSAAVRVRATIS